ncbi:MAG: metallophosphoesterase family protein [Pseudomonadota bacterium]
MFNKRTAINMSSGRLGVLADIHANLEALEAVLKDMEALGIDRFITLGDVVGYGRNPGECLELVRERAMFNLAGNHDRAVAVGEGVDEMSPSARQAVSWTRGRLSAAELEYLGNLPLEHQAGRLHCVHGSTLDPALFNYVLSADHARQALAATIRQVVLVGHSHIPAIYVEVEYRRIFAGLIHRVESVGGDEVRLETSKRYVINVGSVGQPRNGDPRACYGLLHFESQCFRLIRVPYHVEAVSEKSKLPAAGGEEGVCLHVQPSLAKREFGGWPVVGGGAAMNLEPQGGNLLLSDEAGKLAARYFRECLGLDPGWISEVRLEAAGDSTLIFLDAAHPKAPSLLIVRTDHRPGLDKIVPYHEIREHPVRQAVSFFCGRGLSNLAEIKEVGGRLYSRSCISYNSEELPHGGPVRSRLGLWVHDCLTEDLDHRHDLNRHTLPDGTSLSFDFGLAFFCRYYPPFYTHELGLADGDIVECWRFLVEVLNNYAQSTIKPESRRLAGIRKEYPGIPGESLILYYLRNFKTYFPRRLGCGGFFGKLKGVPFEPGRITGLAEAVGVGLKRVQSWQDFQAAISAQKLSALDLRGLNLSGADLRRAGLVGADLREADLTGSRLAGADLRGGDLRGACLNGADFTGAKLDGTKWPSGMVRS